MAKLTAVQQRFIVRGLACYDTPTQVAQAVQAEFGLELTRQAVARYDPTKAQGYNLAKVLRELFNETRKEFLKEIDKIPVANQAYRLRVISRLLETAEKRNNAVLASQLLEQAAKEVGGAYTNARRVEASAPGGGPIQHEHTHAHDLSDDALAAIATGGGS